MEQLPTILAGIILAAILWVVKGTSDNGKALAVLQSAVDHHVMPELKRLRDSGHETRDVAQSSLSIGELNTQRLDQAEQQIRDLWDGSNRRSGADRREATT